jgi:thiamine kinase
MSAPPGDADRIEFAARRLGMAVSSVEVLTGGLRNRCYGLSDNGRSVVVRIAGPHDGDYAVTRTTESLAQRTAAASGLAPRILLEEPDLGLTVMERVPGEAWSRCLAGSPAGAALLGEWLGKLHALPAPDGMPGIDFVDSLGHYAAALGDDVAAMSLVEKARATGAGLGRETRTVLCHNDLHHLNIVGSATWIVVIDWEYAGLGDPIMDLAGFTAYHDLDAVALQALLRSYSRQHALPSPERLADARWLFEAVWWAWLALRSTLEADEPPEAAGARRRLAARLGINSAGS